MRSSRRRPTPCAVSRSVRALPASDPFKTYWVRDYRGIMYVNKFLKDRLGINTRYMIDNDQNRRLQRALQGDAYALRAWWQYDLLRKWEAGAPTGGC